MMDFWNQLPERIQRILHKGNLRDSHNLLTFSILSLKDHGLEKNDLQLIKTLITKKYQNQFLKASECLTTESNKWKRLSFGCKSIDKIMRNGVSNRGITEISGEAGNGKSQICLQLSLTVQLTEENGGFGKGAAFICTEDAFPSKRLYQMAQNFSPRYGQHSFLDKIFIEHMSDSDKLLNCVTVQLPQLCRQESIGLIVIDSVAAVYRIETNAINRAMDMRKVAQALQSLSSEYGCVIICVNQVTSVVEDNGQNKVVPCLGLAWSNLVTTRIQIHRNRLSDIREFEIIFSPELPQTTAKFLISEEGIVDV